MATGTSLSLRIMDKSRRDSVPLHIARDVTSRAFRTTFEVVPTTGVVASLAQLQGTSWYQGNLDVCMFRHELPVNLRDLAHFPLPAYLGGFEVNKLFSSLVSHCSTAHRVVYRHEQEIAGQPCAIGHAYETIALGRDSAGAPRAPGHRAL